MSTPLRSTCSIERLNRSFGTSALGLVRENMHAARSLVEALALAGYGRAKRWAGPLEIVQATATSVRAVA